MKGDGSTWDCFDDEDLEEDKPCWSKEDKDLLDPVVCIIKSIKVRKMQVKSSQKLYC